LYRPWRPLGLYEVEVPIFSDIQLIDGGKVVSPTCRPLCTPRWFLVLISVRGWVDPRAIVLLEGLGKLKKSTSSGTWTGDLLACSIVPQPTTLPSATPFWGGGKLRKQLLLCIYSLNTKFLLNHVQKFSLYLTGHIMSLPQRSTGWCCLGEQSLFTVRVILVFKGLYSHINHNTAMNFVHIMNNISFLYIGPALSLKIIYFYKAPIN
jgi:hypothetical protein